MYFDTNIQLFILIIQLANILLNAFSFVISEEIEATCGESDVEIN
jgi:hypothetical protein